MQKLSGATKGAIVGATLAVGVITGGMWAGSAPSQTTTVDAADCHHQILAGKGFSINTCPRPHENDKVSRNIKKGVGTTVTGCAIGLASGGPVGAGWGCLGGLASNIPWAGW